ncbi:MAG: DUF1501 domain-containing protein [Planctomycetales bacterium]|nr:DUF1501 domain-containing protein [Planctomycetales bacterium]
MLSFIPPHVSFDRRAFLLAGGLSCFGADIAGSAMACAAERAARGEGVAAAGEIGSGRRKIAKSAIMIWLSGGASHIDTWDMKPNAPLEYRGEFHPVATSAPGIELCEHLPHLAKQAHHLAVVRSLGDFHRGTGDHHAGYYTNLTGHSPDPTFHRLLNARTPYPTDWPSMASVVAMKRPPHPSLPNAITLPQKEGAPEYTRPGQFAARLGIEYDPLFVDGSRAKPLDFTVPALTLQGKITREQVASRRELLATLDRAQQSAEQSHALSDYQKHQLKAFSLLTSSEAKSAFDIGSEPESVRQKYGSSITGTSMLMARRLVEAGVPFVTVFWKENKELDKLCKSGGGWDTHGNNFHCLKERLLPEFDQPFAALLDDLHQRGLLDETLVIVSSEMGRRPKIGDPRSGGVSGAGRDHWTHGMSTLLAGGGIQGGQVYGSTDKLAEYPKDNPVGAEHIARTVFHSLGIDDLMAKDREGRPFHLMDEGRVLTELF